MEIKCLHDPFLKHAKKYGDSVAAISSDSSLSYNYISEKSAKIAQALTQAGTKPNTLVAVVMEKNPQQATACLGILRAGAGYLPINASLPPQRIEEILKLGKIKVIISTTNSLNKIDKKIFNQHKILLIDKENFEEDYQTATSIARASPKNIAYVIFTSGSTGIPKGVVIDHFGAMNTILDINSRFSVSDKDRILALSDLSFDLSVYDIFGMLTAGAAIVFPDHDKTRDPEHWLKLITQHNITIWNTVPMFMQMLVEYYNLLPAKTKQQFRQKLKSSLRLVLLSGDWIPLELPEKIRAIFPKAEIVSLGGATEASIWSIFYLINSINPNWNSIPYGKPLTKQTIHVLDDNLNPCHGKAIGEIYIGGSGVALGYWRDTKKTQASFIYHPKTKERLYKTGDLGRLMEDGNIEFIGRKDTQIKLQGFRVELGEIESRINRLPYVKQCIVLVKEQTGNKTLTAYCALNDSSITANDLKTRLRAELPEYMVPNQFCLIKKMPLSSNGKVDKSALAKIEINNTALSQTEENKFLQQCRELIPNINLEDNFFEAGGNSLQAIRLIAKIRDNLGYELGVNKLFSAKNLNEIKLLVNSSGSNSHLPSIERIICKDKFPISYAQKRLWFLAQLYPNDPFYNVGKVFEINGKLNVNKILECLNNLTKQHSILRTYFSENNQQLWQCIQKELIIKLESFDLRQCTPQLKNQAWQKTAFDFIRQPFDLKKTPLFRAGIIYLTNEKNILMLSFHHIITDGWSVANFIQELSKQYNEGFSQNSEEPYQYIDYTAWQQKFLISSNYDLNHQLEFWRKQLQGTLPTLNLPYDEQEDREFNTQGKCFYFTIDSELLEQIKTSAQKKNTSWFSYLLAAYVLMLKFICQQNDIIIGVPVAGRRMQAFEDILGFFVNTLPLRFQLDEIVTIDQLLQLVISSFTAAYENQDIPFDILVSEMRQQIQVSDFPLCQTLLVLQNTPIDKLILDNATVEPIPIDPETAKFPLMLTLEPKQNSLHGTFEYASKYFTNSSVAKFSQHFITALHYLINQPLTKIAFINLLSEDEKRQLHAFSENTNHSPPHYGIKELFEVQAMHSPHNYALTYGSQTINYKLLNETANQFAHFLLSKGVEKGSIVGLYLPRSIEQMVSLLALIKCHAVCLPLEENYPEDRLSYMLADSKAKYLITQPVMKKTIALQKNCLIITYPQSAELNYYANTNLFQETTISDCLYIIYTSGSTGKPKGVQIPCFCLTNLVIWQTKNLKPTAKTLQYTNLSFDVSYQEILSTLCYGGELFIISEQLRKDYAQLIKFIAEKKIERIFLPYVSLKYLVEAATDLQITPTALSEVITAGEQLICNDTLRSFFAKIPAATLYNMYGPTETAVIVTSFPLPKNINEWKNWAPIGKPIDNACVYILDRNLQLLPVGVTGEIYIAIKPMAKGYNNLPELTNEKFMPNPHNKNYPTIYKTGDLGKFNQKGEIIFLGRNDNQYKINGHRIELGEIESCLNNCPNIINSAVIIVGISDKPSLIAYVVTSSPEFYDSDQIKMFLATKLPSHMIPRKIIRLDALPKTSTDKIDRKQLIVMAAQFSNLQESPQEKPDALEQTILDACSKLFGTNQLNLDDNFFDLGADSISISRLHTNLAKNISSNLSLIDLFSYPNIRQLAQYIRNQGKSLPNSQFKNKSQDITNNNDIAIIGMAGKFPGAEDVLEYWFNILHGIKNIEIDEELLAKNRSAGNAYFVPATANMGSEDLFDADFFGISPSEAQTMDPQQRHFIMGLFHALNNAGYDPFSYQGKIGVIGCTGQNVYQKNLLSAEQDLSLFDEHQIMIGNESDYIATRAAYLLNLRGPVFTLQTACSSSLVAIHLAAKSLQAGESDIMLAGGITINHELRKGYQYKPGHIFSADGHCRAFDEGASGIVPGNGYGIVVLKTLAKAVSDRDHIYAVIKSSAINNDGKQKVGFTAPSAMGQAEVIAETYQKANINPEQIKYIETHGTGTSIGDPIEISALKQVFQKYTNKTQFCAISSVKNQIGHLDAAAGVANFIKATLSVYHKQLPAMIDFRRPNPKIEIEASPFYINQHSKPWEESYAATYAAVSSFGIGGTNAHVLLGNAPVLNENLTTNNQSISHLLVFSAKNIDSLSTMRQQYIGFFRNNPNSSLANVSFTLMYGRPLLRYRSFMTVNNIAEARQKLADDNKLVCLDKEQLPKSPRCVFMFPGQGVSFIDLTKNIYSTCDVFKEIIDEATNILMPYLNFNLREALCSDLNNQQHYNPKDTKFSQIAIFTISYALAKQLMAWGVQPEALVGYSIGEYVAACLAEVFSFADALKLVAKRGELLQAAPEGKMLAIFSSAEKVNYYLNKDLSIAIINSDNFFIISGSCDAVDQLCLKLSANKIKYKLLQVTRAFHSKNIMPAMNKFLSVLKTIKMNSPKAAYLSNVSGNWIKPEEATDPNYWVKHSIQTVLFATAIDKLATSGFNLFIEVGPGKSLTDIVKINTKNNYNITALSTSRNLLNTIGALWSHGIIPHENTFFSNLKPRRISLPNYPFQLSPYWPDKASYKPSINLKKAPIDYWFYRIGWIKNITKAADLHDLQQICFIVFTNIEDTRDIKELLKSLQHNRCDYILIKPGQEFTKITPNEYTINLSASSSYENLLQNITPKQQICLLHLFDSNQPESINYHHNFYSLTYFIQAYDKICAPKPLTIIALTKHLFSLSESDPVSPGKSLLLGPIAVIPKEYFYTRTCCIDLGDSTNLFQIICENLLIDLEKNLIAYRNNAKWVRTIEPQVIDIDQDFSYQQNGTYLITGGLGGLGLSFAQHIATRTKANLILTTKSDFPPFSEWQKFLSSNPKENLISQKIKILQYCLHLESSVIVLKSDVSDAKQIDSLADYISNHHKNLDGIIHAAGVAGAGIIQLKDEKSTQSVFAPKIDGTLNLLKLIKKYHPGFVALCSSKTAIIPTAGQADYTSANAFMDAFAHYLQKKEKITHSISINWDVWQEIGMSFRVERPKDLQKLQDKYVAAGIKPAEGCQVLDCALKTSLPQIIISAQKINHSSWPKETKKQTQSKLSSTKDPDIIKDIFFKHLGLDYINDEDDFFQLGGHSLMAINLVNEVSSILNLNLSVAEFLKSPTIKGIREFLGKATLLDTNLTHHHNNPSGIPTFLIHAIDGDVLSYKQLISEISANRSIYTISASTLLTENDKVYGSLSEQASHYLQQIKTCCDPEKNYDLVAWSYGGLIAHEMISMLDKSEQERIRLFMIDPPSPFVYQNLNHKEQSKLLPSFIKILLQQYDEKQTDKLISSDTTLDDAIAAIDLKLDDTKDQKQLINLSYLQRVLNTYKLHLKFMHEYKPKKIAYARNALFEAKNKNQFYLDLNPNKKPLNKIWQSLYHYPITYYRLDGDHFSILKEPAIHKIAKHIK